MEKEYFSVVSERADFLETVERENAEVLNALGCCLPALQQLFTVQDLQLHECDYAAVFNSSAGFTKGAGCVKAWFWSPPVLLVSRVCGLLGDGACDSLQDGYTPLENWSELVAFGPSVGPLVTAITNWAAKFNLDEDWVKQFAVRTLCYWLMNPDEPHSWYFLSSLSLPLEIMDADDDEDAYWPPGPVVRPFNLTIRLRLGEYDPLHEIKRKALCDAEEEIEWYVSQVIAPWYESIGYDPDRKKKRKRELNAEHFNWLAAYQTLSMSPAEICKRFSLSGPKDEMAKRVFVSITRLSERIGLPLRPALEKGRKRRALNSPQQKFPYNSSHKRC